MARVEASVEIPAPLADVWDLYFDRRRWRSWVDGFGSVIASDGYPERGGTLSWRSNEAGRGEVTERVLAHDPRTLHRVAFSDPSTEGELETRFEIAPAEGEDRITRVSQILDYRLPGGGPLRAITDRLFIQSQLRGSLQRSLVDLRAELTARPASSERD